MLKELYISNYALIENTKIDFDAGMSVITGETGAGKSILLGALGLLLGQRIDQQVLFDKEKKCVVEAVFDVSAYNLQDFFAENDADYNDQTIIRREILPTGKSRNFVNDSPASVSFLKEISKKLIDIHSQHQNLLLSDDSFHLMVVDAVAENEKLLTDYQSEYQQFKYLQAEEKKMIEDNEKLKADFEYLDFQHRQLLDAGLKPGEQAELEQDRDRLSHAEEIKTELTFAVEALESEGAILENLMAISARFQKIQNYLPKEIKAIERVESARIDLMDLLSELKRINDTVDFDPEKIANTEHRLDLIYSLLQKHHVQNVEELIEKQQDFEHKLTNINDFDAELENLRKQIAEKQKSLQTLADKLTEKRKAVFETIENYIHSQVREMGMENARFAVSCEKATDFLPTGQDVLKFLFSANKSGQLSDIAKVASGGEISRLMLSIKSLLSKSKGLPTIIFDEIDTGVSGSVADKMGQIMSEMAENMQVIAITHLPQVATKGTCHYKVFKTDTDERTISNIERLDADKRVEEIAKMLSGATVSEAAMQNARELLR